MTYRHTCNATKYSQKRQVHSETLEMQADNTGQVENSPNQVDFDAGGVGYLYKAHEYQPCGAGQSGVLPVFVGPIPDYTFTHNVAITPVDLSVYWLGDVGLFGLTVTPSGLSFDTGTGILSGTPDTESSTNPIADGDGIDSNVFNISVVAA